MAKDSTAAPTPEAPRKKRRTVLWIVIGVIAVLVACAIIASLGGDDKNGGPAGEPTAARVAEVPTIAQAVATAAQPTVVRTAAPAQATPVPTAEPTTAPPTSTPLPTETQLPTSTPEPTATPPPSSTSEPTATPEPIVFEGSGQWASDEMTLPWPITVAHFTHSGSRNFVVKVYSGDDTDLLINEIGPFDGTRPLVATAPITFDLMADGAWSITMTPISFQDTAAFSGVGQQVSGIFDPPSRGAWEIFHDGKQNFAVWCHCAGGTQLVQNEIGPVSGSRVVAFDDGPCFWEVVADGSWSLAPKQ